MGCVQGMPRLTRARCGVDWCLFALQFQTNSSSWRPHPLLFWSRSSTASFPLESQSTPLPFIQSGWAPPSPPMHCWNGTASPSLWSSLVDFGICSKLAIKHDLNYSISPWLLQVFFTKGYVLVLGTVVSMMSPIHCEALTQNAHAERARPHDRGTQPILERNRRKFVVSTLLTLLN